MHCATEDDTGLRLKCISCCAEMLYANKNNTYRIMKSNKPLSKLASHDNDMMNKISILVVYLNSKFIQIKELLFKSSQTSVFPPVKKTRHDRSGPLPPEFHLYHCTICEKI